MSGKTIHCTRGLAQECRDRGQQFEPKDWNLRQKYYVCPQCQREINKKYRKNKKDASSMIDSIQPRLPETGGVSRYAHNKVQDMVRDFGNEINQRSSEVFDFTDETTLARGKRECGICPTCGRRGEMPSSIYMKGLKMFIHLAAVFNGQSRTIDYCTEGAPGGRKPESESAKASRKQRLTSDS